jgi:SpoVK/Ycf46/Vps4 family AAA+-type ATPase
MTSPLAFDAAGRVADRSPAPTRDLVGVSRYLVLASMDPDGSRAAHWPAGLAGEFAADCIRCVVARLWREADRAAAEVISVFPSRPTAPHRQAAVRITGEAEAVLALAPEDMPPEFHRWLQEHVRKLSRLAMVVNGSDELSSSERWSVLDAIAGDISYYHSWSAAHTVISNIVAALIPPSSEGVKGAESFKSWYGSSDRFPEEGVLRGFMEDIDDHLRTGRGLPRDVSEIKPPVGPAPDASPPTIDQKALDEALAELNHMVGMTAVEAQVQHVASLVQVQRARTAAGLQNPTVSHHLAFVGPPGTGKTTVARLIARIFKALGALREGQLIETSRDDLVAGYVGQTATKTSRVIDSALDGVLFIDEAYALAPPDAPQDFGHEAIETLLKRMEDDRERLIVIVAGYESEMRRFLKSNPGLASRFAHTIRFTDYNATALLAIYKQLCLSSGFVLGTDAAAVAQRRIAEGWRQHGKDFGNARTVRSFFDETIERQSIRLATDGSVPTGRDDLMLLTPADIPPALESSVSSNQADDDSVDSLMQQLDKLVGLDDVKQQVRRVTDLMRVRAARADAGLSVPEVSEHLVFLGPPGTGKTTVARLIARIYRAIGVVPQGHLVEVARQDLVAGYTGQTAIKTNEAIDNAIGGILFIDEAYALTRSGVSDDFGMEAVETLLKRMEDDRGRFIVIAAGYGEEMEAFLRSNPGLASRFGDRITFSEYDSPALVEIFGGMVADQGYVLSDAAKTTANMRIADSYAHRSASFANARTIRSFFENAISNQASRIANLNLKDAELLSRIEEADLPISFESGGRSS